MESLSTMVVVRGLFKRNKLEIVVTIEDESTEVEGRFTGKKMCGSIRAHLYQKPHILSRHFGTDVPSAHQKSSATRAKSSFHTLASLSLQSDSIRRGHETQ